MNDKPELWVLGGDLRQVWLARQLALDGFPVCVFGMEQAGLSPAPARVEDDLSGLSAAEGVVLPMPPATPDGLLYAPLSPCRVELEHLFSLLRPEQLICAGRPSDKTEALARERGLRLHNYFAREEVVVANCVPTAEGCIQLAMEHLPITIQGAGVLVLGYGRVGQQTARRFAALGARVSAAARRPEVLAQIEADGLEALSLPLCSNAPCPFDLIVNTVPAPVLDAAVLGQTRPDVLLIELASPPGGIDASSARRLSRRLLCAPGLPGKAAPAAAASIIRRAICHLLQEQ